MPPKRFSNDRIAASKATVPGVSIVPCLSNLTPSLRRLSRVIPITPICSDSNSPAFNFASGPTASSMRLPNADTALPTAFSVRSE